MQEKEVKELIEEIYAEKLKELSKNSERSPGEGFLEHQLQDFVLEKTITHQLLLNQPTL